MLRLLVEKMASYRVVALVSGGKDSCYSMLQAVTAGHEIVALANLRPKDEKGNSLIFWVILQSKK